jgi:Lectin C-type domain
LIIILAKSNSHTAAFKLGDPFGGEFWTSGTDKDCPGKFHWCANDRILLPSEAIWKSGHPSENGDCVYLVSAVGPMNASHVANDDCNAKKRFLCEVNLPFLELDLNLLKYFVGFQHF